MTELFEGKTYIVTGASSGIGRAVCIELSRQRANVVLVGRNEERLNDTLSKMEAGSHQLMSFDLSDIQKINGISEEAYKKYEAIDGIVYCAGFTGHTTLKGSTYEALHPYMLIHYYAFVELIRCVVNSKKKKHPMRIVGMSSVGSILVIDNLTAYSAAKAAMDAAVRVLAVELIKKNVTINSIRPANVDTEMLNDLHDIYGDFGEQIKKTVQPLGLIDPVDVAKMALYLLSDAAKSITGMAVPINGGVRF